MLVTQNLTKNAGGAATLQCFFLILWYINLFPVLFAESHKKIYHREAILQGKSNGERVWEPNTSYEMALNGNLGKRTEQ